MTYTIKIKQFEGPFDLLLFFIERDELDIYDIPIATITEDFLAYMREMESMNIDLASEFILVAATLMRIKAKMLLPRKELDEEGNEIDPREELVQRLLEYKRYKEVIEDLRSYEERRGKVNPRGNASDELQKIANKALVDVELESITMFKLLTDCWSFWIESWRAIESSIEVCVHVALKFQTKRKKAKACLNETHTLCAHSALCKFVCKIKMVA